MQTSIEDTNSTKSKKVIPKKPPRQGKKYKLPRQISEESSGSDNMEIVPAQGGGYHREKTHRKPTEDQISTVSTLKEYVIRGKRYNINDPKKDARALDKAKRRRELIEKLRRKYSVEREYVITPRKVANGNVQRGKKSTGLSNSKSSRNSAIKMSHTKSLNGEYSRKTKPSLYRDSKTEKKQSDDSKDMNQHGSSKSSRSNSEKTFPNGILKKTPTAPPVKSATHNEKLRSSRIGTKYHKHGQGALRHSSQKVTAGGSDRFSLDTPDWVVQSY